MWQTHSPLVCLQILRKLRAKNAKPAQRKLGKDRPRGVNSAGVQAFLAKREREEKEKAESEQRKKDELLKKREELNTAKVAKAMASRTKDNIQITKDKLARFVAKEKEREQLKLDKQEKKYQRQMDKYEKAVMKAEGQTESKRKEKTHKRDQSEKSKSDKKHSSNSKHSAKSKTSVCAEVKTAEKKPVPRPRQNAKPPMDFHQLIKIANEKSKNIQSIESVQAELLKPQKTDRPMTQAEKDRMARVQTKEYQHFLKKGGKRPDFSGNSVVTENPRSESPAPNANATKFTGIKATARKSVGFKATVANGQVNTAASCSRPAPPKTEAPPNIVVNETVIQCGPGGNSAKRKSEPVINPFDRAVQRFKSKPPPAKRPRMTIDSDSEYDSEMDDFIDDEEGDTDVSSAIREIFGYDKRKYRHEKEDVSGMEANFSSIMREEARSARLGMKEDLEDIRREQDELRRKAERKKMKKGR